MGLSTAILVACLGAIALADQSDDLITNLPGINYTLNFRQYSGYVAGSSDGNIQFHYWFVESQSSPSTDPVILWLNGGPGCSSVDGLLEENGPFLINDDGVTLRPNPYSWNEGANVLYFESPACVGYSYAKDGNCKINDDGTSLENYIALQNFFLEFDQFKTNPFYITGESYAGIYIPTLVVRILEGTDEEMMARFQGYMIGNGLLDWTQNYNSLLNFGYTHGIFADDLWDSLVENCCHDNQTHCNYLDQSHKSPKCTKAYGAAQKAMENPDLQPYNIYAPCYHPTSHVHTKGAQVKHNLMQQMRFPALKGKMTGDGDGVPCTNLTAATTYMNEPSVRAALHIPSSLGEWQVCNTFAYIYQYETMQSQFQTILQAQYQEKRGLLYYGDIDSVCNLLQPQWFLEDQLGLGPQVAWSPWIMPVSGQIGGHGATYAKNLRYITVRDAGHEVPQYKPAEALAMLYYFINDLF